MEYYVFDTSAFIVLFNNYYRSRFPTLWDNFNELVETGRIVSTREVKREIQDQVDDLSVWADKATQSELFPMPTRAVADFVSKIFQFEHFQGNVERKKLLNGGKNADPFVVATAASRPPEQSVAVVTLEKYKDHAAKIPNMCHHFGVRCMNLEGFMEEEGWEF